MTGALVRIVVADFAEDADSYSDMGGYEDAHLRACLDDGTEAARERADVLYFDGAVSADVVAAQLEAYPGCMVVAGALADGSVAVALRARGSGPGSGIAVDCASIASLVHALLTRVARGEGARAPRSGLIVRCPERRPKRLGT